MKISELRSIINEEIQKLREDTIKDFEYLIHHIDRKHGKEVVHHCRLYDHIGNMFIQDHLIIKNNIARLNNKKLSDGTFHVITGLEPIQEVCWSDSEAEVAGIKPKMMIDGMTKKDKAKVW